MFNPLIKIYYACDDELSEWEAVNREWRSDVLFIAIKICTI